MDRTTTYEEDSLSMVFSDLTSLDSGTDEFGRKLLQHTRDAQRINHVLNSQPQAFRKARHPPTIALTLDNLERNHNNLANQVHPSQIRSTSHSPPRSDAAPSVASSSTASDPPLNVPRQWGRKGRHNNDWLKRINQNNDPLNHEALVDQNHDSLSNHQLPHTKHNSQTAQTSHVDWLAAADVSNGQSVSAYSHETHQDKSLPSLRHWEADQDLTAASLLASTPALPSRNRQAIEDIRRRELESPADDSHKSRSLRDQSPSYPRRRRDLNNRHEHTSYSPRLSTATENKENFPLKSTRSDNKPTLRSSYNAIESDTARGPPATQPLAPPSPRTDRPSQRRVDGMALLKRLARASQSPSPNSAKNSPDNLDHNTSPSNAQTPTHGQARGERETTRPDIAQLKPKPEPQTKNIDDNHETPLPARTPVVTGAWVDTPRTGKTASQVTNIPDNFTGETVYPRCRSEPNLPTSALAAVLGNMRAHKSDHTDDDPTLGDSTIASLEGILDPAHDAAKGVDTTVTLDVPDALLPHTTNDDDNTIDVKPTTQADRDRRQEDLALEALNKQLASTKASIHEASKGLKKAARKVRDPVTDSTLFEVPTTTDDSRHDCGCTCKTCLGDRSIFKAAWREYWSLYFRPDTASSWGWRLTWLGLSCLIFWTWLATENTLCSVYCHPTYASSMRGYGVDPDAPRFPFVIPTLLFRPFEEIWRPVVGLLAWCLGGLYTFVVSEDGASSSSSSSSVSTPGARSDFGFGGRPAQAASKVSWFSFGKSNGVAHDEGEDVWVKGRVRRMNAWDQGQKAWEAPGESGGSYSWESSDSMLDDEYV